jgi:hypothetical protein
MGGIMSQAAETELLKAGWWDGMYITLCELCKKCHEFSMNGECDKESLSLMEFLIGNTGANRVEPVISNCGRNTRATWKSLPFYPILESSAE